MNRKKTHIEAPMFSNKLLYAADKAVPAYERKEQRGRIAGDDTLIYKYGKIATPKRVAAAIRSLQAQLKAHEAVRDVCFVALPECQVWGDLPGHIEELKAQLEQEREERNGAEYAAKTLAESLKTTQMQVQTLGWQCLELETRYTACHSELVRANADLAAAREVDEGLREDAERYQVARNWGINAPTSFSYRGSNCTPGPVAASYADAAIDAARVQQPAEGNKL